MARSLTHLKILGKFIMSCQATRSLTFRSRIMSATIRDNILFSHKYDEVFYNLVLDGPSYYSYLAGDVL